MGACFSLLELSVRSEFLSKEKQVAMGLTLFIQSALNSYKTFF
jgi:hypothetical protein